MAVKLSKIPLVPTWYIPVHPSILKGSLTTYFIIPVQVRAQLDEERNITALVPRQPLEVHETVAECMIYANHWVARKIQETFPYQALLRRHPPPREEFFSELVESAAAKGFTIETR